jgi:hypothetical protein
MNARSFVDEVAIGTTSRQVSAKVSSEAFKGIIDAYKPVSRSGVDPYVSGEFECLAKGKVVRFFVDETLPNEEVVYFNSDV